MRSNRALPILFLCICMYGLLGCSSEQEPAPSETSVAPDRQAYHLIFAGGPKGGTFNFFANKMTAIITESVVSADVSALESGGSVDNLRYLNRHEVDMAIIYAGDAFLGSKGTLPDDSANYHNVRALAFLYGAPAQLVVRKDSGIDSVQDLIGKRVGVGNPGSGAAMAAQRLFTHFKVWDRIDVRHQGYSKAAAEFVAGRLDAFWVLVGYPNASVIEAATQVPIDILSLHDEAAVGGFYEVYPFYSLTEIPAGTYPGQDATVVTFQDTALWCVHDEVDEQVVYESLCSIYCKGSLEAMRASHKAAHEMSVAGGVRGVSIPLHHGAARFWDERGVAVPPSLRP